MEEINLLELVARANNFLMEIEVKGDSVHEMSWLLERLPKAYNELLKAAQERSKATAEEGVESA